MREVTEKNVCDKCGKTSNSHDNWLSIEWWVRDPMNGSRTQRIDLCPECFGDFRKWVKRDG